MPGYQVRSDMWFHEPISPWDLYSHGITRMIVDQKTDYQHMMIFETGFYGKALVLDSKWQSCTSDEFIYHESLVHPAMIMHGEPKNVLVLGGGEGATVREVLRWNSVQRVVMVDIDKQVVDACREHLPEMHQGAFDDPRTELIIDDALVYLDQTKERWDVVISDLSDPIEAGPAYKLFTKEYFEQVKRVMTPDGMFVVQAGPTGPAELDMHAGLVHTIESVFAHVVSYGTQIPSFATPWGFALGSVRAFDVLPEPSGIDKLLADRGVSGLRLIDGRSLIGLLQAPKYIRDAIDAQTQVFTQANPPRYQGKGQLD